MTLREARVTFSRLMAKLVLKAEALGLELAYNEVYRPEEMAKIYQARGVGVFPSAHTQGLAVDILLYRKGVYLTDTADYRPLGEYWIKLHDNCRWGGTFKNPDGGHFSFKYGGLA